MVNKLRRWWFKPIAVPSVLLRKYMQHMHRNGAELYSIGFFVGDAYVCLTGDFGLEEVDAWLDKADSLGVDIEVANGLWVGPLWGHLGYPELRRDLTDFMRVARGYK